MIRSNTPHRRKSIRLPGYDYSQGGEYFVTIVAFNHQPIFGNVTNDDMNLSPVGMVVQNCWEIIPEHFPNTELGASIIMPNHFHAIIHIIDDDCRDTVNGDDGDRRGTIYRAPTTEQFGKPVVGSIPTIIRTFKAAVTRIVARELHTTPVWQRNYYEHIITSEREYIQIEAYIENNPTNWLNDREILT